MPKGAPYAVAGVDAKPRNATSEAATANALLLPLLQIQEICGYFIQVGRIRCADIKVQNYF